MARYKTNFLTAENLKGETKKLILIITEMSLDFTPIGTENN